MPTTPITGTAAGVPYLAVPPEGGGTGTSPVVAAWHLMDAPRSEAAFAAALPMSGLGAWRVYLGLPMTGSRAPAGGPEELMRLGYEDAVLNLQEPVITQAAGEFAAALAVLRDRLGVAGGPLALVGGSIGAAVASLVLAESEIDVAAAVLVSPLVQLRPAVDAMARQFGFDYPWPDAAVEVAHRLDFVARAGEIAGRGQPAVLIVVGEDDDQAGFRTPAADLRAALASRYDDSRRVRLTQVPGMGHALAEEPGLDAAPQTQAAATVDRHVVDWLGRHLTTTSRRAGPARPGAAGGQAR